MPDPAPFSYRRLISLSSYSLLFYSCKNSCMTLSMTPLLQAETTQSSLDLTWNDVFSISLRLPKRDALPPAGVGTLLMSSHVFSSLYYMHYFQKTMAARCRGMGTPPVGWQRHLRGAGRYGFGPATRRPGAPPPYKVAVSRQRTSATETTMYSSNDKASDEKQMWLEAESLRRIAFFGICIRFVSQILFSKCYSLLIRFIFDFYPTMLPYTLVV